MLDSRLCRAVQPIELLEAAALLRRKIEVVVPVVLMSSLALLWKLTMALVCPPTNDLLDVLLHAWPRIERHILDVDG